MNEDLYDIIVIGCGSGGLSVGLFMAKAGFKTLMVSKSDRDIGGDCLNDGCVPSKAIIHVAKIIRNAKESENFGLQVNGNVDIKKVVDYIYDRQEDIRKHENASWLREQGVDVALGDAHFTSKNEIEVDGKKYNGQKIVIATGSKPRKLKVPGVKNVTYYDNESIFHIDMLPGKLLVIGGGPIGIEIAQTMSRLGSKVTVVHKGEMILEHDEKTVAAILCQQLRKEGIEFLFKASVTEFTSANEAKVKIENREELTVNFDAVFVAIGRELNLETLQLNKAGIEVKEKGIVIDKYLRTTNKNVFVCGDVAGDLKFSHAAEFHARILLNNFFSPLNKKLNDDHMSWVTFTDPELATFGLSEKQLKERGVSYEKLEQGFEDDDRAVVDNFQYAKMILFIRKKGFLKKQKILGGTMIAPGAGELVQELILANTKGISINAIFNKIYPYPVASRINQKIVVEYKSRGLTENIKKLLHFAYKIFS
ncbi:MAG: FAD-dependent oxidoreductase [Ginsengibacter sp.]